LVRAAAGDAGDGIEPLKIPREGAVRSSIRASKRAIGWLVQALDVAEQSLKPEDVMVGDAAAVQGLPRLRRRLPRAAPRQGREGLRVAFPGHQRPEIARRRAEHIRSHVAELDVGRLQDLLDPVGRPVGSKSHDQIDTAYRTKCRRYGGRYVDPMVSPAARAATIKL
jgi:hypothetical protein